MVVYIISYIFALRNITINILTNISINQVANIIKKYESYRPTFEKLRTEFTKTKKYYHLNGAGEFKYTETRYYLFSWLIYTFWYKNA